MIKSTTKTQPPAPLQLSDSDIAVLAAYFTTASDRENVLKHERIQALQSSIRDNSASIQRRKNEIEEFKHDIAEYKADIENIETDIKNTPPRAAVSTEEARNDLTRTLLLPYIKSIVIEGGYLIATTRENSLFTTLDRKYSHAERWYRAKPYRIPLPAYHIRVKLSPARSLSQNADGLAIALVDPKRNTGNFISWTTRYVYEPHAHWGTRNIDRGGEDGYCGVCLGEYEGEVTSSFSKSIADGVIALAIYLQNAGTSHAYVSKRELWALWLGNPVYNALIVPSETETKTLKEAEDEENSDSDDEENDFCECRPDIDDVCNDDENCTCACHG